MSMSILYHAFGIKGVTYKSTYLLGNGVFFRVETTEPHYRCPKVRSEALYLQRGKDTLASHATNWPKTSDT